MKPIKIAAINPGSTSTKIAVFMDEDPIFKTTVEHTATELSRYKSVQEQLPYRQETILRTLKESGICLEDCDAYAGRGGGLAPCPGGVYEVSPLMLQHSADPTRSGTNHPAALGPHLANRFAEKYGGRAFVVNPPDADELCDEARITGLKGVYRSSKCHFLNQKEVALQVCAEMDLAYQACNLVVAHIGGGVSVAAHRRGKIIDCCDIINGEGPMTPTRAGALPVTGVLKALNTMSAGELELALVKTGGFISHLGTADTRQILRRIGEGDRYAELIYNSFIYQIVKEIGAMSGVLEGCVDAVILTGGIANDRHLCERVEKAVRFIAPVKIRPGELEMEALAHGALRVLRGEETVLRYTGIPPFTGFGEK